MKSKPYKFQGKLFRYNFDQCYVEYISKAGEEDFANEAEWKRKHDKGFLGIDEEGYMVLASVGLSTANWKNKAARDEYLFVWCAELDEESAALVADFVKYELPHLEEGETNQGECSDSDGAESKKSEREEYKYLVQSKSSDRAMTFGLFTAQEIIDMFGMRDCSECEYEVYDVGVFGFVQKLTHRSDSFNEPRYHRFVSPMFGATTVFSGFRGSRNFVVDSH